MESNWKTRALERKREVVLAMKRDGKPEREIAAAVGMSLIWVAKTWGRMRKSDPRAAEVAPMRSGGRRKAVEAVEAVIAPVPAPAWDFSGDDIEPGEGI